MSSLEGTAENKSSLDRPVENGGNLTENREQMAKKIVQDLSEKTNEQKPLDPKYDAFSINILERILNGQLIAKDVEQDVVAYLNRRINEIRSKISNDQLLTNTDRRLMVNLIDIGKDYKIRDFEIEWFKENKPFDQNEKKNINKVDQKLINEFIKITGTYWDKILLCNPFSLLASVVSILKEMYTLRSLDGSLKQYNLSVRSLFQFVLSFQTSAVAKAENMIFENRKIVRNERERYQNNKNGAIDGLYNILTKDYAVAFNEADRLRATGLKRFAKNRSSIPIGYLVEYKQDDANWINSLSDLSEEKIVEKYISRWPPGQAEKIVISHALVDMNLSVPEINKNYPEFKEARLIDSMVIQKIKANNASKYPILKDINTDYSILARRFKGNPKGFKTEILKKLSSYEESANKTLEILYKTPSKIWELKPLINITMTAEGIKEGDNSGKLIQDRIHDKERGDNIRDIFMLAIGIVLSFAAPFAEGIAWASLALEAGDITLNGINLYNELNNYNLHSNAAKATLGGELSDKPGVLGVALAIFDLAKSGYSFANAIKAADSIITSKNTISVADDLYSKLEKEKMIDTQNIPREEFIKKIKASFKEGTNTTIETILEEIPKKLEEKN
jgi:hypothetical protein